MNEIKVLPLSEGKVYSVIEYECPYCDTQTIADYYEEDASGKDEYISVFCTTCGCRTDFEKMSNLNGLLKRSS